MDLRHGRAGQRLRLKPRKDLHTGEGGDPSAPLQELQRTADSDRLWQTQRVEANAVGLPLVRTTAAPHEEAGGRQGALLRSVIARAAPKPTQQEVDGGLRCVRLIRENALFVACCWSTARS